MKGWLIVSLVVGSLVAGRVDAAQEDLVKASVGVGSVVGSALLITTVGGLDFIDTLPYGVIPASIVVGSYLEATTNCAKRGLPPYERSYTTITVGSRTRQVSEEQVKWEPGTEGWMQLRCGKVQ